MYWILNITTGKLTPDTIVYNIHNDNDDYFQSGLLLSPPLLEPLFKPNICRRQRGDWMPGIVGHIEGRCFNMISVCKGGWSG